MNKDTLCSDGPLFSGTVDITPIVPIYWLVVIGSLLSCLFLTAPCTLYPGTANTHRKRTHKGYKKFLSVNSQQFCIFEGSHFSWVRHCISNIPSNLLRYPEGGNLLPLVKITSVSTAIIPLAATSSISFIPFQLRSSLCCGASVLGWCALGVLCIAPLHESGLHNLFSQVLFPNHTARHSLSISIGSLHIYPQPNK